MDFKNNLTNFCIEIINQKMVENGISSNSTGECDIRMSLLPNGILDSFDLVELVVALETEFAITVDLDGLDLSELSVEKLVNAATD